MGACGNLPDGDEQQGNEMSSGPSSQEEGRRHAALHQSDLDLKSKLLAAGQYGQRCCAEYDADTAMNAH